MALTSAPPTTSQVGWTSSVDAVSWSALLASAVRVVDVASLAQFDAALAGAVPGDYIRVLDSVGSPSTWYASQTYVNGTEALPIIIGPQTEHAVTFSMATTNRTWLNLYNHWYIVGGFRFVNYLSKIFYFRNGTDVRVTRNYMDNVGGGSNGYYWEVDYGAVRSRIDHNYITNLQKEGRYTVRDPASYTNPTGGRFDHNTILVVNGVCHCQLGQGSYLYNDSTDPGANGGDWDLSAVYEYNDNRSSGSYGEQPSVKASNCVIRHNWFHEGNRAIAKLRQCNGTRVYGNYYGPNINSAGAALLSMQGENNHIYGNIYDMTNCELKYVAFSGMGGFQGSSPYNPTINNIFEHNTIINPNGKIVTGVLFGNVSASISSYHTGPDGTLYRNNVIVSNNGTYSSSVSGYNTSYWDNESAVNNIVYGSAAHGSLITGFGSGTIDADPDLDGDYRPSTGSPAIGAGANITTTITDYFGSQVSQTSPDIGAVQYQSVSINHGAHHNTMMRRR